MSKMYIAIDLKSFYASVECMERGLDPITTNLVVADASRTEKTICLAVSPSLKTYGISGRARLFEVVQTVKEANVRRKNKAPNRKLTGSSYIDTELKANPSLAIDYITACPQMARYIDISTKIYNIYLKYIAPEDIHVYSIDEVFIDATSYLKVNKLNPREFAKQIILDIFKTTGITATAGIGTNLYLCKVAMDIVAKHTKADEDGARIAQLDEMSYRRTLWEHEPLTDFWRIGRGYAKKLEAHGIYTMGDIARCSVGMPDKHLNEDLLYKLFGVNAELLIDHAWGWEPCTLTEVKAYKPETSSMGSGQVLPSPYSFEKAKLVVREMTDLLILDLTDKGLVTNQLVLTVGYDIDNLKTPELRKKYKGETTTDYYGRKVPKPAHGTQNLGRYTSSTKLALEAVTELFERIIDKNLLVRRINITANNVMDEASAEKEEIPQQLDLFSNSADTETKRTNEKAELEKERHRQQAIIKINKKFGKNSLIKGMNLKEGATTINRNKQIGGHKA